MQITVVIPTYNRRKSLQRLLQTLNDSQYKFHEVFIVDASDDRFQATEANQFTNLKISVLPSEPSVCIQRNIGIRRASTEWIFLCDDDLEVPPDYVSKIVAHLIAHPAAGAVTGVVLQKNGRGNTWTEQYPITSSFDLLFRFMFKMSIWGGFEIRKSRFPVRNIIEYYQKKGNHMSLAGWPVVTDFYGEFFRTPFYGLGAAVVRKAWLESSPYDEVLDPNGIGDNYGVAAGFPEEGIHVLNDAFVFHFRETANRLVRDELYYRRILALDYFRQTKKELAINKWWFYWSVIGSSIAMVVHQRGKAIPMNIRLLWKIFSGQNPYVIGKRAGRKIINPAVV